MVARYGSAVRPQGAFHADAFRFGCRPHGIESGFDGFGKMDRLKLETKPAGDDTRYIEHVFDQLGLSFGIAFDRFERPACRHFVEPLGPEDLRPAQNGVERSPQLVRQDREEFVFGPVGLLGFAVQTGILQNPMTPSTV